MDRTQYTRSRFGKAVLILLVAFLTLAPPSAAGEEDMYAQLMRRYEDMNAHLDNVLLEYEAECRGVVPEYPARMLAMRKKADLRIGGEMRMNYAYTRSRWKDPGFSPGLPNFPANARTDARVADLTVSTARVFIDARVAERWRAFVDLNLQGQYGMHQKYRLRNPNTPADFDPERPYAKERENNNLSQAYIELMKGDHSGFGFLAGVMKLPFGLWDRPNLIAKSYMDAPNLTESYLMPANGWTDAQILPHPSRLVDPVAAVMVNYEMRDIIRFDAALFQEQEARHVAYQRGGGFHIRSDESLFRSWQLGLSLQPLEGWELTAHFRNRYSRTRGLAAWINTPQRWDFYQNRATVRSSNPRWDGVNGQWSDAGAGPGFGGTTNEQSFVVGLAVEIPNTKLAARAEYAHGWNQGFNKYIGTDNVNVGLSYRATPFLTLHAQGEWLHVNDRSWMASDGAGGWNRDHRDHDLYRLMVGAEYELLRGLTVEAGWQYEYWKIKSARGGQGGGAEKRVNAANTFYMGTRFIF